MASDSKMMSLVVKDCKQVFEEMDSLVDVGGGTGVIAKNILGAFPHIKCTVLDLPHVVANMPETENLKYVGGDMFQSIPPADAFLFKLVMHD
ncbi:PREDICTED: isoflavone 4'-O-methyltransferase-like [Nicotiana attenuata]|uniref:isoflavone 4'-O-methyltransferase-like n=1 Tax=Nicotiana attenuata TaxID=49451 RepID=UPI00090474EB|nr:PREDICTED: isoflavone 4'-O-methyltransferase-like [Nicotiana attenuata]